MKTVKVSHLVVNGCSFTYCQGLENPKITGWPALLAKKLGVPVVNIAARGSGNDAITRRTYEYFYKDKKNLNNPLYIIAWSYSTRREEYQEVYKNQEIKEFFGISTGGWDDDSVLEKELVKNMLSHEGLLACERKKLLFGLAVKQLFLSNNIPYIMTDFIPQHDLNVTKDLEKQFPEMFDDFYHDANKILDLEKLGRDHKDKILSCGHYASEMMPIIADFVYDEIVKRYNIEIVYNDYLRLDSYRTEHKGNWYNNLWRIFK